MASILKHIRSSTASKRPVASGLADGQLAINTASGTPGLFFKDNASGIVKIGPAHVGAIAPNSSPAGSAGNSLGEIWINNSTTIQGLNYYNGSSFVNLTPSGTTSAAGLVELATPAETQAGTDGIRAVTPSGLQSKVSDSISTTSSTTIASATAVKTAYDLANAALARTGGTVTGEIVISPSGSISFEGSSDDGFETTLAVVNPTADRTITFPNITGTVITSADTGTVTSTMIANGTIVDEDINASASIALSKLATGALPSGITVNSSNISDLSIVNDDISASAGIVDSKLATISGADKVSISALNIDGGADIGAALADADLIIVDDGGAGTNRKSALTRIPIYTFSKVSGDITISASGVAAISNGAIVDAEVSASAAIAGTKINPNFGGQTIVSSGVFSHPLGTSSAPSITFTGDLNTGIYSPGADQVAIAISGVERISIDSVGTTTFTSAGTTSPAIFRISGSEIGRWDSGGRLLVGISASRAIGTTTGAFVQVETNSIAGSYLRYSEDNVGAVVSLGKARGSTSGSVTAVQSGDTLGELRFAGANGTDVSNIGASISTSVDGAPFTAGDTTDLPGRLVFSTTTDGSSSPTERLRIASNGLHTINTNAQSGAALSTTAPAKLYTASGAYTDTSTAASGVVSHGTIVAFDNPLINSTNSAVVYTNASTVYIDGAPAGTGNVTVTNPYALYVNAGTSFFGGNVNLSSGNEYRINNTKVVGARVTGWAAATGTATRTTFATSTVTTAQLAERVKALIDDLISHGLIGT